MARTSQSYRAWLSKHRGRRGWLHLPWRTYCRLFTRAGEARSTLVHCEWCDGRAQMHDRREPLLRNAPMSSRPRCWCPKTDLALPRPGLRSQDLDRTQPVAAPRQVLTGQARHSMTSRVVRAGWHTRFAIRVVGLRFVAVVGKRPQRRGQRRCAGGEQIDGLPDVARDGGEADTEAGRRRPGVGVVSRDGQREQRLPPLGQAPPAGPDAVAVCAVETASVGRLVFLPGLVSPR